VSPLKRLVIAAAAAASTACAAQPQAPAADPVPAAEAADAGADRAPFSSTYAPEPSPPTLIRGATVLTGTGTRIDGGDVLIVGGKVQSVGTALPAPEGARIVEANGRWVTPGLIDVHSHMGVYASPGTDALDDGNESTDPVTSNVWAEHSVWPQDPGFEAALQGGVTSMQILPGSANLIGGRGVTIKVVPATTYQAMKFPGAPHGLKMACGENPKRVYATRGPSTRMGNVAGYRAQWILAEAYRRKWDKWNTDKKGDAPTRDLALETLAEVLRGNILVHNHCYRADEMAQMLDVAREFGYQIRSFHHVVEGYKLADRLAAAGVAASIWADWGAFKMEALDGVKANAAILQATGARAIIHSDDPSGSQRLNQEAAKAMAAGAAIGLPVASADAIKWLTINPAWALGLDDRIGSLEANKNADLVLWSGDPFSVYTRAEKVWIDGALRFDRSAPDTRWRTDFELGFVPEEAR
jgi:imidazolonepropionase-like amidohydrolase